MFHPWLMVWLFISCSNLIATYGFSCTSHLTSANPHLWLSEFGSNTDSMTPHLHTESHSQNERSGKFTFKVSMCKCDCIVHFETEFPYVAQHVLKLGILLFPTRVLNAAEINQVSPFIDRLHSNLTQCAYYKNFKLSFLKTPKAKLSKVISSNSKQMGIGFYPLYFDFQITHSSETSWPSESETVNSLLGLLWGPTITQLHTATHVRGYYCAIFLFLCMLPGK